MADDYYSVLGVSRTATGDEIQKAYRRLARRHHPDLADDKEQAKEQFQKVQHAYDVLSDEKKRQLYDQLGPAYEQAGGRNPFADGQMPEGFDMEQIFGRGGAPAGGFEEILRQVFGGAAPGGATSGFGGYGRGSGPAAAQGPARGQDLEQEITVPFATAVLGGRHQLSLTRSSGMVETITVTIPPGITNGKKIRLRGQGRSASRGGHRGDLLVKVKVAAHPCYQRIGDNLQVTVPVTVTEAALGAKVDLPTPRGTVTLTVPPGSSSGKVLRLKGFGVVRKEGGSGDLLAELKIVLPSPISAEEERLFRQLAAASGGEAPRLKLSW
jgi:DnaJ-class molecular chaperone